jgi:hypothetical protein
MDGVAAVLVSRWEWDGAGRTRIEPATELPLVATAPAEGPQLWDASTASD